MMFWSNKLMTFVGSDRKIPFWEGPWEDAQGKTGIFFHFLKFKPDMIVRPKVDLVKHTIAGEKEIYECRLNEFGFPGEVSEESFLNKWKKLGILKFKEVSDVPFSMAWELKRLKAAIKVQSEIEESGTVDKYVEDKRDSDFNRYRIIKPMELHLKGKKVEVKPVEEKRQEITN